MDEEFGNIPSYGEEAVIAHVLRPSFVMGGDVFYSSHPLTVKALGNDGKRVKFLDDDGRMKVRTLISTPNLDLHGHIVKPEAFRNTIAPGGIFHERPLMLAFHSWEKPIGLWPEQQITEEGLWLGGWITKSTAAGREMQELVMEGIVNGSSIGWFPKKTSFNDEIEAMVIEELDLFEGSLVPLPANLDTFIEVAKSWCLTKAAPLVARGTAARPLQGEGEKVLVPETPGEAWDAVAETAAVLASLGKSIRAGAGASAAACAAGE